MVQRLLSWSVCVCARVSVHWLQVLRQVRHQAHQQALRGDGVGGCSQGRHQGVRGVPARGHEPDIGMRCMGHGVFAKTTSWKAVDVKHCHGTWEMVQQHEPCTCNAEWCSSSTLNSLSPTDKPQVVEQTKQNEYCAGLDYEAFVDNFFYQPESKK
ncbi:hypothetical protein C0Q70_07028 [Pomacea canaliculata]|uniref:SBSPON-like C-terminal domain-containing protein n=1 Tax=Pomacea canaliculata TaxID=400727 RepID=A0A2T7PDW5_POMCA|nr:hypothetical protein C0Q70_07028 [Pomacea canaliculata]